MENIHSLAYAKNLVLLKDELSQASIETGWFGERIVVFQGSSIHGSISLNDLALNISIAAYERMLAGDLTLKERIAGLDLSDKLKNFYIQPNLKKSAKTISSLALFIFQYLQTMWFSATHNPHPCRLTGPLYWRTSAPIRKIIKWGRIEKFFRIYYTEEELLKDFRDAPIAQKPLRHHLISRNTSKWQPKNSFLVEERQIQLLACALSRSYPKPTAEMIKSITFGRCLNICDCSIGSSLQTEDPGLQRGGSRGRARVFWTHEDFCAEGCTHECTIKLKDGREQYAQTAKKFGGIDLLKVTKDQIFWSEEYRSHFKNRKQTIYLFENKPEVITGSLDRVNQWLAENFFYASCYTRSTSMAPKRTAFKAF